MSPAVSVTQRTKRIQILNEAERADLYDPPHFTDADRRIAFTLSDAEASLLPRSPEDLVHAWLILQVGYFKAKRRFFPLRLPEMQDDLLYILTDMGCSMDPTELRLPNPRTVNQQRQQILAYQRYRHTHAEERTALFQVALKAARISPKPQYLVRVILQYCATERIILPAYTTLQETIVSKAITAEEDRLIALLHEHLTDADQDTLESLFERADGRYRLTTLRRAPKTWVGARCVASAPAPRISSAATISPPASSRPWAFHVKR